MESGGKLLIYKILIIAFFYKTSRINRIIKIIMINGLITTDTLFSGQSMLCPYLAAN